MIFILAILTIIFLFIFLEKIVRTILILIVLAGLLYYVFALSNMIRPYNKHTKYSIDYIRQQAYSNMHTHKDSVRYYLIIKPIYNDLHKHYTEAELIKQEKDPIKYYKILAQSIRRNKKLIIKNLAKSKEKQMWRDFLNELRRNYLQNKNAQ
jgi:hypothetical protein